MGAGTPAASIYKAMSHPLRLQILKQMKEAGEPIAPVEVAARTGQEDQLCNISYHFRELAKLGLIEISEEEAVRGATKHFYVLGDAFPIELGSVLLGELREH